MTRRPPAQINTPYVQIPNDDWAPIEKDKPRARRTQPTVAEWDHALLALARVQHPRCAWWWHIGTVNGQHGMHCYVCNELIAATYVKAKTTKSDQDAIVAHRARHYLDSLSHLAVRRDAL